MKHSIPKSRIENDSARNQDYDESEDDNGDYAVPVSRTHELSRDRITSYKIIGEG